MTPEKRNFYRFGNFKLDPREKLLYEGDKAISLAPKFSTPCFYWLEIADIF